jgi:hypothetical protein
VGRLVHGMECTSITTLVQNMLLNGLIGVAG